LVSELWMVWRAKNLGSLEFDFHGKAFAWYYYCLPSYTDITADLEFTSPFTR